jgi:hypothetical protein
VPRLLRVLAISTFTLLVAHAAAGAAAQPIDTRDASQASEYDVKAAYIFNLLPFTTWPPSAFRSPSAPLTICVAQPDPFGNALERTFQHEDVAAHPVVITHVSSVDELAGCHVLFLGAAADASGTLEAAAAKAPLLTIGEGPRFEGRGGMITFVVELGRVRFDVNKSAAGRANIQFSSKILQVARKIS